MDHGGLEAESKPATAARMYDYFLGGYHNFPADRAAAEKIIAQFPSAVGAARSNRAFLRRAVRHVTNLGVRQFLDLGSGIPTEGNVHHIAQDIAPQARVVYVDIDPVAVSESLEILDGNAHATAICEDFRNLEAVLSHQRVRPLLDLGQPIAVLLAAALHFVPDDAAAYALVNRLVDSAVPGSYLVLSHGALESAPSGGGDPKELKDVYRTRTATAVKPRTRPEIEKFFAGTDLVEPGLVWAAQWRPDPDEPDPLTEDPVSSGNWAGVGRKPR